MPLMATYEIMKMEITMPIDLVESDTLATIKEKIAAVWHRISHMRVDGSQILIDGCSSVALESLRDSSVRISVIEKPKIVATPLEIIVENSDTPEANTSPAPANSSLKNRSIAAKIGLFALVFILLAGLAVALYFCITAPPLLGIG